MPLTWSGCVGAVVWIIATLIVRDLSASYVSGIISEAKAETENLVRVMEEIEPLFEIIHKGIQELRDE